MPRPLVAVTGAAGFVGRYLVDALVARDYRVRAIDLASRLREAKVHPAVEVRPADLRSGESASEAIEGNDLSILLAARSAGIGYFNRHPATILQDNCQITANTFAALREHRVPRVIYISSSCVFDRATVYKATEESLSTTPPPTPGYPFSKLVGEAYCKAFAMEYAINFTIIRPFNVYGPGEFPGHEWGDAHAIPDLLEKILSGIRPIPLFGSGQQTRSFTYVTDLVDGIIRTVEREEACRDEDFNLGMPEEVSIQALLQSLWTLTGHTGHPPWESRPTFRVDPPRRAIDISKAQRLLDWHPEIRLEEGLRRYIAWYQVARTSADPTRGTRG